MNCFELLGLAPSAAVDPDDLQARYGERLKSDAAGEELPRPDEAALHQAYATLRDPVKRLAHLLELAGSGPARTSPLPDAMMDLFARVGAELQASSTVLQESRRASSPLARALLAEREMSAQTALQRMLGEIHSLREDLNGALLEIQPGDIPTLQAIHGQLAFLEKWRAQVQERLLQFLSLP